MGGGAGQVRVVALIAAADEAGDDLALVLEPGAAEGRDGGAGRHVHALAAGDIDEGGDEGAGRPGPLFKNAQREAGAPRIIGLQVALEVGEGDAALLADVQEGLGEVVSGGDVGAPVSPKQRRSAGGGELVFEELEGVGGEPADAVIAGVLEGAEQRWDGGRADGEGDHVGDGVGGEGRAVRGRVADEDAEVARGFFPEDGLGDGAQDLRDGGGGVLLEGEEAVEGAPADIGVRVGDGDSEQGEGCGALAPGSVEGPPPGGARSELEDDARGEAAPDLGEGEDGGDDEEGEGGAEEALPLAHGSLGSVLGMKSAQRRSSRMR